MERIGRLIIAFACAGLPCCAILLAAGCGGKDEALPGSAPEKPAEAPAPAPPAPLQEKDDPAAVNRKYGEITLSGFAVDKVTGEPVSDFRLRLVRVEEGLSGGVEVLNRHVRDSEGVFSFFLKKAGPHVLYVRSPSYLPRAMELDFDVHTGIQDLEVRLEPGLAISGKVAAEPAGAPVAGASVMDLDEYLTTPAAERHWVCGEKIESDAEGRFRLGWLEQKRYRLAVLHDDFAAAVIEASPSSDEVAVTLKPGARVRGTICTSRGVPVKAAEVQFSQPPLPLPRPARVNSLGEFVSPPFLPGEVEAAVVLPAGLDAAALGLDLKPVKVAVAGSDVELSFGPPPRFVAWKGTFLDWKGNAVVNGRIDLIPAAAAALPEGAQQRHIGIVCDAEGRFSQEKLYPGEYRVVLTVPNLTGPPVEWGQVSLGESDVLEKDIRITGAVISGVVIDELTGSPAVGQCRVRAMLAGETPKAFMCATDRESRFYLVNVVPGTYTLTVEAAAMQRRPRGTLKDLAVAENQVLEEVQLVLPAYGEVSVFFTEMDDVRGLGYQIVFENAEGGRIDQGRTKVGSAEQWRVNANLRLGTWKATISMEGLPDLVREFEIKAQETTELPLKGSDLLGAR